MPSTRIRTLAVIITTAAVAAPVTACLTLAGPAAAAVPARTSPASGTVSAPAGASSVTRVLINAGGPATVVGHTRWIEDRYATGGHPISTHAPIRGTTADAFFRRARAGMTGYRIPVGAAGTFRVTLKFAEIEGRARGQRVFAVTAEGRKILSRVDIAATAGRDHAISTSRRVSVRDGALNLGFPARQGQALVSGIAVQRLAAAPVKRVVPVTTLKPGGSTRSGLPWASGVYMPGGSPAVFESFGAWRGRRIDVATMWTARSTWSDLINPDWLYRTWKGTQMTKVIGVSPIPEGDSTATLAKCADGRYDDKWIQFGHNIRAAGLDDESVIRLGWEFNGDWYKWSARNPADFAGCWRHIVGTVQKIAPALRWDWNVNAGAGQSVTDARQAWPGNAYVDIVGVDSYDVWPGVTTPASWNTHLNGAYGLNFWRDFAVAHHKPLSVPEWGVYPGTSHIGHNGGDNAYYIEKMHNFFAANASVMAYESYFNESAAYYAGSLFGPTQNPRAAAAYRSRF